MKYTLYKDILSFPASNFVVPVDAWLFDVLQGFWIRETITFTCLALFCLCYSLDDATHATSSV